jgi:hypothetical protein
MPVPFRVLYAGVIFSNNPPDPRVTGPGAQADLSLSQSAGVGRTDGVLRDFRSSVA